MANNTGTLVIAAVRPASDQDTYPVAFANEVKGGHHQVPLIADRDAITPDRRQIGMWCTVAEDGKTYKLEAGIENINWQQVVFGSSGTVADAGDVIYTNPSDPSIANVEDAINKLMYKPINITGFSNDIGTVEIGTVISAVNLVWSLDQVPTEQSIDSPLGNTIMAVGDRALLVNGISLTTDFAFKLNVTDGKTPKSTTTTVAFRSKRYHGVSAMTDIDDTELLTLTSEFSTSKVLHDSVDGGGMYLYFAFPESFGDVKFKVNGLQNTAWVKTTRGVTNAVGYIQNYNIYRSATVQNGTDILIDTY